MEGRRIDPAHIPEGVTEPYLRRAVSRVQRWTRNRYRKGHTRSVPRHIHEMAMVVRQHILMRQGGTPV